MLIVFVFSKQHLVFFTYSTNLKNLKCFIDAKGLYFFKQEDRNLFFQKDFSFFLKTNFVFQALHIWIAKLCNPDVNFCMSLLDTFVTVSFICVTRSTSARRRGGNRFDYQLKSSQNQNIHSTTYYYYVRCATLILVLIVREMPWRYTLPSTVRAQSQSSCNQKLIVCNIWGINAL